MPDQFTFAALDRLLRDGGDARPLFAQVATGSSHAPWVPVPDMVDWDEIGDGRIFNEMAASGDPPDVVWRDRDRVRDQYRQAIDYALNVVFDYAARHAADPPLIFVVGDHQAAGFVALDETSGRAGARHRARAWSPRRRTGAGSRASFPARRARQAPWRRCGTSSSTAYTVPAPGGCDS
jgi:hypothetical protein